FESINLFLLFLVLALLLDECLVFFEEFIEQHHVNVLIADGVGFSLFVLEYQVRIDLCYFFSNQAKGGRVVHLALVVEGHWSKRQNGFAGLAHGLNVLLEPRRGDRGTRLVVRVNTYAQRGVANDRSVDTADKSLRGEGNWLYAVVADADEAVFARMTGHA